MSNKTHDSTPHSKSSLHSDGESNENHLSTKSHIISESKKNEDQHTNEGDIKSSFKEQSQHSHDKHQNDNRSESPYHSHRKHSFEDEEQPSMNDHSKSSFHINEPSNDGPIQTHLHTLSQEHEDNHSHNNKLLHSSNDINHTHNESLNNSEDLSESATRQRPNIVKKPKQNDHNSKEPELDNPHPSCTFRSGMKWLDLQLKEGRDDMCRTPQDLENEIEGPPVPVNEKILDKVQGSIIGMALGDALGAHVEFRPYEYVEKHPVTQLEGGGTWGLQPGQFTDDTSMALCLANSLIARKDFIPYDQLVRYKWWYRKGYMSSTGQCFDIGAATSQSIHEFEERQRDFADDHVIPPKQLDRLSDLELIGEFNVYCSEDNVAGNGALMRLAPVPLFFFRNKYIAIEFSGVSGEITHGDKKAYDACRYYGALIVAALRGYTKEQILARNFYSAHRHWFGDEPLAPEIQAIAEGSFKIKAGHAGGIEGKGYIVKALEAALWAFWSDGGSFKTGALNAVNLGDDTDTTAAIYGQLAGAYYGYEGLPKEWRKQVFAKNYMKKISAWIVYEGEEWNNERINSARSHK